MCPLQKRQKAVASDAATWPAAEPADTLQLVKQDVRHLIITNIVFTRSYFSGWWSWGSGVGFVVGVVRGLRGRQGSANIAQLYLLTNCGYVESNSSAANILFR